MPILRDTPPLHGTRFWSGVAAATCRIVFLLAIFVIACSSAMAQESVLTKSYKKAADSEIRVVRVFSGSLPSGMEPYQITVRNRTQKPMVFTLRFDFGRDSGDQRSYSSTFRVVGDAGVESVHQVLVPTAPVTSGGGYYFSSSVGVSSPGLEKHEVYPSQSRTAEWPMIAISEKLAARNLAALNTAFESSSSSPGSHLSLPFARTFEKEMLPGEWRGYSGLDALMITTDEWRDTAVAARQATLEWVRLGGHLLLYSTSNEPLGALDLASPVRSLGGIKVVAWDGDKLDPAKTIAALRSTPVRAHNLTEDYDSNWGVRTGFPSKKFNSFLIVILLIAFGVIVGPVNLFVFAKAGKRHRLFVTTPVISIIASILIAVLILFADGLGGSGSRLLFVDLEPEPAEKKAYLKQEQFSRSGVLLSSSFPIDEAVLISPVELGQSRWVRGTQGSYQLAGNTYSGDWFQSRSEQGQLIETVRPTRSRVELRRPAEGDAPPELFSSVEFSLGSLHYIDDAGQAWKANAEVIAAGQTIAMQKAKSVDLVKWWKTQIAPFSASQRADIAALSRRKGVFFAISDDPKVGFIDTLDAIRWRDDKALIFGTVLPTTGTPTAP